MTSSTAINRVIPLELEGSNVNIDKEKYRNMLLDAAVTVLSTFGFSREAYGIPIRRLASWLRELGEEIRNERELEVDVEEKMSTDTHKCRNGAGGLHTQMGSKPKIIINKILNYLKLSYVTFDLTTKFC